MGEERNGPRNCWTPGRKKSVRHSVVELSISTTENVPVMTDIQTQSVIHNHIDCLINICSQYLTWLR